MTGPAATRKADIDREVDLTYGILRRHGIPANHGDATYLVARGHERRSMDDLLERIDSGRDVPPWQVGYVSNLVEREFEVEAHVLRRAIDELHAAIHPAHSTVTGLRAMIRADPAMAHIALCDLSQSAKMRRKLPLMEAQGITTLGTFAARAYEIAPVWTSAVLSVLGAYVADRRGPEHGRKNVNTRSPTTRKEME